MFFKTRVGELVKRKIERKFDYTNDMDVTSVAPLDSDKFQRLPPTYSEVDAPPRGEVPLSVLNDVPRRRSPLTSEGVHEDYCAPYELMN